MKGLIILQLFVLLFSFKLLPSQALVHNYKFVVQEAPYTRLCSSKDILTVNGQFPGPTLRLRQGDTILVNVFNRGRENITIHWHGVFQPRFPWSDGPEYITQCPIQPGSNFTQRIDLSDEIGTMWWHAHSEWSRATVHGLLVVYPNRGVSQPFPTPQGELSIVLGEWWRSDIVEVFTQFQRGGGDPTPSDAYLINGQPGDFYNCSSADTSRLIVESGKTYIVRMVNSAMNNILFFSIANHRITVVGYDGSYTKPVATDYIAIAPGQTVDFLLEANQRPNLYYAAARAFVSGPGRFNPTITTAILQYRGNYTPSPSPNFPINLPNLNDSSAPGNFLTRLRSLENNVDVPLTVNTNLLFALSVNLRNCEANNTCLGPGGLRLAASINNISFVLPRISVLQAYYNNINGVYGDDFPSSPPFIFNFTDANISTAFQIPNLGTEVRVVEYNSTVELVFQGTNVVSGVEHPIHLHGYSFYVVGTGPGNFDRERDPLNYNLVDPPFMNTVVIPRNSWAAIRFRANNPGVWFMHCHFDRHASWGMAMAFIVKDGKGTGEQMLPPPPGMPPC